MDSSTSPARRAFAAQARAAALGLLVGLLGALACVHLGTPLPWLVGPLIAVAATRMAGVPLAIVAGGRAAGQWAIGVALGLYFTPEVMREIVRLAPWIALNVLFAIALGLAGAWMLRRLAEVDAATGFFATAIGGASEMAVQAERQGGRVDRVAAAHSLRIMLVVLVVPFAFKWLDVHGADPYVAGARAFDAAGFAVLTAVTLGAVAILQRFDSPNAWMLGPLSAALLLTANGITLSALPVEVINGGQLLIGVALGARFSQEFFRAAPRFLGAVALVTLMYLAAGAAFGLLLASGAGLHWSTAVIATTPGGIGEMALTAKALKLGVPIVTAFHTIRMTAVVASVGVVWRWYRRRAG